MADLEHEKDLEEEEFKTTAKPSTTSRTMPNRICNRNVNYQNEQDHADNEELDDDSDSEKDELEDEESSKNDDYNDGYSSPDIDYESLPCYD